MRSEPDRRPSSYLRRSAREIIAAVLESIDAGKAVADSVKLEGGRLVVCNEPFDIRDDSQIYLIALGKAAGKMALALERVLGAGIAKGVVSCTECGLRFPRHWQVFNGGHPLPTEASLNAGRAALQLLQEANHPEALIVFLISGGGSAMMEWPADPAISLPALQSVNRLLTTSAATITEINIVRRALSALKGGGLAMAAPLATQISLIVSDTNRGDEMSVASGPTFPEFPAEASQDIPQDILNRHNIWERLPYSVIEFLKQRRLPEISRPGPEGLKRYYVLLDNNDAIKSTHEAATARGFQVEFAPEISEQPVEAGCRQLVASLFQSLRTNALSRPVCLVSGGEFACPVRGGGYGGRNTETALRCAFLIEAEIKKGPQGFFAVVLSAGTDGIDGNSPAAGALADNTSLERARGLGFDPWEFLENSDSYSFFRDLGDTIKTGPTGTNVRDIRILLGMNRGR